MLSYIYQAPEPAAQVISLSPYPFLFFATHFILVALHIIIRHSALPGVRNRDCWRTFFWFQPATPTTTAAATITRQSPPWAVEHDGSAQYVADLPPRTYARLCDSAEWAVNVQIGPQTRTFDAWSQANGRSQHLPIAVLKDTAVGIDADSYLRKLLVSLNEPLVSALGGFPYSLGSILLRDLRDFRDAGIKPLFVFSGLDIEPSEEPFSVKDDSAILRTRGWDLYDRGQATEAVDAFSQAGVMSISDLIRLAMRFLADERVEFQVAPYAVWPQVSHVLVCVFVCERVIILSIFMHLYSYQVNCSWYTSRTRAISMPYSLALRCFFSTLKR